MSRLLTPTWTAIALLAIAMPSPLLGQNAPGTPLEPAPVIRDRNGAEMVLIPAGDFWMGSDEAEIDQFLKACLEANGRGTPMSEPECASLGRLETPRHRVVLGAYYIDRYEVTNGLFEQFIKITRYRTTADADGHSWIWQQKDGRSQWLKVTRTSWRKPRGPESEAQANHPVVHVSWKDADAYCRWASKRLPTEAEWEKAARGTYERRYPWGQDWNASRANGEMSVEATTTVGAYPEGTSPYLADDMAGNVWEWTADWSDERYYEASPNQDPQGPSSGKRKVLRGGSWHQDQAFLRSAFRNSNQPENHADNLGFRCAVSAPQVTEAITVQEVS